MAITRSQIARQLLQQGGVSMVDPRMQQSLAQNIAVNEANREINQAMRKPGGLRDLYQKYGFSSPQIQTQFAPSMSRNPMMELANRQNLVRAIAGRSGQTGSAVNNFVPDTKSREEIELDRIIAENERIFREYMDKQAGVILDSGVLPGTGRGIGPGTTPPEKDQSLISRLTKLTPLQATRFDPFEQLSDIDQYTLSLAYPELMSQRRDTSFTPGSDFVAPIEYQLFQRRFGLKKGGMPTLKDAKENAPPGEFLAYINPKEADMLRAAGGSGIMTAMGIPSFVDFGPDFTGSIDTVGPSGFSTSRSGPDTRGSTDPSGDGGGLPPMITADPDKFDKEPPPSVAKSFFERITSPIGDARQNLSINYIRNELDRRKNYEQSIPGKLGFKLDTTPFDSKYANRTEELEDALTRAIVGEDVTATIQKGRFGGGDDGGDFEPTLFRQNLVPVPKITEPEKTGIEKVLADADEFRFLLPERFKLEDGGIVPRQGYFAGKLVRKAKKVAKKAARAVKKVAKSPLGKAALAAAALYYAPAAATRLGGANAPAGSFMRLLADQKRMAAFKTLLPGGVSPFTGETSGITKLIQSLGGETLAKETAKNITKDAAKSSLFRDLALITAPSVLAGVLAKKEEGDEDLDAAIARARKDESGLPELLAEFDDFRFVVPEDYRQSAAEGGMMDLGGNEMDLRGGGFVPIGREEKADDVPARLSKNEFVFTADAVRAAGGGSVDKGADLMYKTMKQLENKVA